MFTVLVSKRGMGNLEPGSWNRASDTSLRRARDRPHVPVPVQRPIYNEAAEVGGGLRSRTTRGFLSQRTEDTKNSNGAFSMYPRPAGKHWSMIVTKSQRANICPKNPLCSLRLSRLVIFFSVTSNFQIQPGHAGTGAI